MRQNKYIGRSELLGANAKANQHNENTNRNVSDKIDKHDNDAGDNDPADVDRESNHTRAQALQGFGINLSRIGEMMTARAEGRDRALADETLGKRGGDNTSIDESSQGGGSVGNNFAVSNACGKANAPRKRRGNYEDEQVEGLLSESEKNRSAISRKLEVLEMLLSDDLPLLPIGTMGQQEKEQQHSIPVSRIFDKVTATRSDRRSNLLVPNNGVSSAAAGTNTVPVDTSYCPKIRAIRLPTAPSKGNGFPQHSSRGREGLLESMLVSGAVRAEKPITSEGPKSLLRGNQEKSGWVTKTVLDEAPTTLKGGGSGGQKAPNKQQIISVDNDRPGFHGDISTKPQRGEVGNQNSAERALPNHRPCWWWMSLLSAGDVHGFGVPDTVTVNTTMISPISCASANTKAGESMRGKVGVDHAPISSIETNNNTCGGIHADGSTLATATPTATDGKFYHPSRGHGLIWVYSTTPVNCASHGESRSKLPLNARRKGGVIDDGAEDEPATSSPEATPAPTSGVESRETGGTRGDTIAEQQQQQLLQHELPRHAEEPRSCDKSSSSASFSAVVGLQTEIVHGAEGLLRAARGICSCGRRLGGGSGDSFHGVDGKMVTKLPLAILKIWERAKDFGGKQSARGWEAGSEEYRPKSRQRWLKVVR